MYSCEKDDNSVIDPVLNFPVIDSVFITPATIDSSRINISLNAKVTSVDPVSSVKAKIFDPDNNQLIEVSLSQNGDYYTYNLDYNLSCYLVGNYKVEFTAVSSANINSNLVTGNFVVTNSRNQRPVISLIYAPDSLQRPSGTPPDTIRPAFLKLNVFDPDGICDIDWARFNSINPSGIPSSSNPFTMYDNGDLNPPYSDTVGNDGKYSLTIYIFPGNTYGNYSFKFFAKDRSGLTSDTLLKLINVYQ